MSKDRQQILEMLSLGKITAEEAERLIAALDKAEAYDQGVDSKPKPAPKYLRVLVESEEGNYHGHHYGPTKVNIRVPIQLLRAGVKLASLIPNQAKTHINDALRDNGIDADISKITPENIEELIQHLNELTVDVDERHNKVRVFCE